MSRSAVAILLLASLAALAPLARAAGEYASLAPNAHTLSGRLEPGEEHYVPLDLPEGAVVSLQYRADRKNNPSNQLVPDAELVAPDGRTVEVPSSALSTKKGFDVKNLEIGQTGGHVLVLRGRTNAGGTYTLKVKAKYPKKLSGTLDGNGAELAIPFAATAGASVKASVSGLKGGAVPELPRVRQPNGNEFGPVQLKTKKTGFSFSGFEQKGEFGVYALTFKVTPDTAALDRTFRYSIGVSWPRATKAAVSYADLIVTPLVTSVTPDDVPVSADLVDLVVEGRFFQPGARVLLKLAGQADWVPENQSATDTQITAPIRTAAQTPGRWDVVAANPSGGQRQVSGALLVRPPTPIVTGCDPAFTFDDRTSEALTMTGTFLAATTTVRFRRTLPGGGFDFFDPTNVQRAPSGSGILVTINPFRRPQAVYDVVVQNPGSGANVPGSEQTVTTGVLEIRNAPPRIDSCSPDRHLASGAFAMTIRGAEFDSGAQALLRRAGEDDVQGLSELVGGGGTTLTATFDMDGRAPGPWQLVVTNPDTQFDTLDDAFAVTTTASTTITDAVLGEPALALAPEHDLGLVAWIESNEPSGSGTRWKVMARVFDAFLNDWVGDATEISSPLLDSAPKRYVSAAYNPDVDQWLVVWTEHTFATNLNELIYAGVTPTSAYVYQVYGRRVGIDGTAVSSVIDFIDHSATATSTTQYYDEFEYLNPQVVHAPWNGDWYMTFTQRWDNLSDNVTYINDDYDAFVWRLAKADPRLDGSADLAIHTTQNHEGDCLAAVDPDRSKLFVVGSIDSRQIAAASRRGIEAKWVTSTGSMEPGSGGSGTGGVLQLTVRGASEAHDHTNPRPAYNPDAGELLVVYERVDETGSGRTEVRAIRVSAAAQSVIGAELVVAEDDDHDLVLPRVVYDPVAEEYLVTWTVDDGGGAGRARAQRLRGSDASASGNAFDLGPAASGLPVVDVDPSRGAYTRVYVTGYTTGAVRSGTGLAVEVSD